MHTVSVILILHSVSLFGQSFQIGHVRPSSSSSSSLELKSNDVNDDDGVSAARHRRVLNHGAKSRATHMSPSFPKKSEQATDLSESQHERRSFLQTAAQSIVFSSSVTASFGSPPALAEISVGSSNDLPQISHKVFMDVRISRADGSFYVRDAAPSDAPADERADIGQLVLGLFGNRAPNHVQQFLKYVEVPFDMDSPLPSYSRSKFQTLDAATGLLIGGTIPGLDVSTLAGGNCLQYSGRIIPAKLWLENKNIAPGDATTPQLSHNMKGLLTHRNLDLTPSFGVTTRTTATSLDATHTIFGCILQDNSGILEKVVDLPVLTDTGMVSMTANEPLNVGGDIGGKLASTVFTTQRKVFRDAAKTFGDTRLEKVYDGKLLRRIEVTKVGVL
eukprot:CAMPEP_0181117908 /NCGR_PEP_ID=MMETSP1071-20121207/22787_1 /TAXON_ID=35127 /ORGANISM="Thalassiosira sp., Strain NH16" /LENGTH=388 /DNA_ID=CAMNT_0023202355 /DNA_START=85 /DNA_END=1252 /DNA_ORIENTATION=+